MFSDCPAFLIPALPFAFISSSNNYIPSTVLRGATPPPTLKLTKHYYKPHVRDVMLRLENARELGNASTDEWIKGLDSEGKDRLSEAVRWELWDAKGGLKKVNLRSHPKSATIQGSNFNGTKASNTKGGTPSDRSTPQGIRLSTICSADSGSPTSASPVNFSYYHPPMSCKSNRNDGNFSSLLNLHTQRPFNQHGHHQSPILTVCHPAFLNHLHSFDLNETSAMSMRPKPLGAQR